MNTRETILKFPEQIQAGLEAAKGFQPSREYTRVILCGMGGSIIPAEILVLFAGHHHLETRYEIWKGYDLPTKASKNDLIICVSWSGTTEETASSLNTAVKKGLDTFLITNPIHEGEEVGQIAQLNEIPTIIIPHEDIPPRFATGYMTAALFSLVRHGDEFDFPLNPADLEEEGKKLASEIGNNIPLFYSAFEWRKPTAFWKILFNENCKLHAFSNTFPGLTHNEIAGFAGTNKNFHPVIFKEPEPDPRIDKNYKAAIAIFEKMGYNYSIVNLSGKLLKTVFDNYILGLWTSYYLALNLGVDPEDITLIEEFKKLKRSL